MNQLSFSRHFLCLVLIFEFILIPTHQFMWGWSKFRIANYAKDDESYFQTELLQFAAFKANLKTMSRYFKPPPVWSKEDPKYLKQVEFHCFMYDPSVHVQPAAKVTAQTSDSVGSDFTFSAETMLKDRNSLKQSFENRKHERFAFITHGWLKIRHDIHRKYFLDVIATDLRAKLKMNVMVVTYTELAKWSYFVSSNENTLYVAEAIRFVIDQLASIMGMTEDEKLNYLNQMLVMGHSLGAHIVGKVGALLTVSHAYNAAQIEKRLGTIVALDPAGPFFPPYGKKRHCVTRNDAKRVLILHTGNIFFGSSYRLGHEDYFANGGERVVASSPGLSHFRCVNLIRELIWYQATGYICKKPKHTYSADDLENPDLIQKFDFNLAKIPDIQGESEIVTHPIYLPVNLKYPYFNNDVKPRKIPSYSKNTKKGWDKIKF